ncbi:MAG: sugar-binding protein [Bacteroidota bacterium]
MRIDIPELLRTTTHPKLLANNEDVDLAKERIKKYPWYASLYERKKAGVDEFLERPVYISPLKQAYEYPNYDCVKHNVQLKYEEHNPFEHRCPVDGEVFRGEKYDAAWAGWYHGTLSRKLVEMGTIYQISGDERYAAAVRDVLTRFAETYSNYPNRNNILGPAHIFFGTLGESVFGTHVSLGYDLVYESPCFSDRDHVKIRDQFLLPLADLSTQFDETVSNRQTWYNNAVASIGFVTNTPELLDWAFNGKRGFLYQLASGLPKSGLWYEGPGYHFFTLEGFILIAEMARHHGLDLYEMEIAGHSIKKMFDAPLNFLAPDFTFPRIKDSGGGSIFSPEKISKYEVGYARYHDDQYGQVLKYAYEKSKINRELEFFFVCNPELPKGEKPVCSHASSNLDGNGFAILRDNLEGDEKFLYLDYGIVGGEHGHPDRLSIGYYAFGQHWILDPLNQDYFKPNLQTWFRQSIAHNTVVLSQSTQAWANGHLNFFGETAGLKVASGFSDQLYGGAHICRTVALLGDCFIDVCDISADDERIIDYPIHSFGELSIEGLHLENQPDDLFGRPPGIPGYDQFTQIRKGKTDGAWSAHFKKGDQTGLIAHVLGAPGSEVFSAMTPGIREDYEKRLPMFFCRRIARETRFVSLIEAHRRQSKALKFGEVERNTYEVLLDDKRHLVHLDAEKNCYWYVTYRQGQIQQISGLNVTQIILNGDKLLESEFPLEKLDIVHKSGNLEVEVTGDFLEFKLFGFEERRVLVNGKPKQVTRTADAIIISASNEENLKYLGPSQIEFFIGLDNTLNIALGNPSTEEKQTKLGIRLESDWREIVDAQAKDWGGIVNLPALHKNSVVKRIFPESLVIADQWLQEAKTKDVVLPPKGQTVEQLRLKPLGDTQPASYPADLLLADRTHCVELCVKEPVSLEYFLPNGAKDTLRFVFRNHTSETRPISLGIIPSTGWHCNKTPLDVRLSPFEKRRLDVPVKHTQYNPDQQQSPIEVELQCEDFIRRWRKDFYIGYCFRALDPRSLDGTFEKWNTTYPLTIDSERQISRLLYGNRPWRGVDDLSAKIYPTYDDEYLYVGAEVKDDIVSTEFDRNMEMPCDFDSIEIILDTRLNGEQGHDPPTAGVSRHIAVPGIKRILFDGRTRGDIPIRFRQIADADTLWKLTEKGYNIVVRIPWKSLPLVAVEPGMKIGFDVALNDNDGTRFRTNQMLWAGFNQNQTWLDLSLIGALILRES